VGDRSLVEASAEIETRTSSSGSELLCLRLSAAERGEGQGTRGFGFGVPGFSARMFFSVFRADFARETCKRERGERGKNYMVIFFMTLIIYLIFYRKSCFFLQKVMSEAERATSRNL
jgi:hypothetical protein